ncbi:MAG TPA: DUF5615 family PIN-like protein [Blastocatellia bacterium]|nr:DUF5615 family PIN-like protein [Blastocatellia bacterium]
MARLYANENFPLPVVEELRRFGHDVLTIQETGKANLSVTDEEVLAFAAAENRAVLTLNRKHFIRLHHVQPAHAGIIVCTFDPDFTRQAGRIHEAIGAQADLTGQLVRVNRPGE